MSISLQNSMPPASQIGECTYRIAAAIAALLFLLTTAI